MKLKELISEVDDAPVDQMEYDVVVHDPESGESHLDVESLEWDHTNQKVVIHLA